MREKAKPIFVIVAYLFATSGTLAGAVSIKTALQLARYK